MERYLFVIHIFQYSIIAKENWYQSIKKSIITKYFFLKRPDTHLSSLCILNLKYVLIWSIIFLFNLETEKFPGEMRNNLV